jgi:hypothetical protein
LPLSRAALALLSLQPLFQQGSQPTVPGIKSVNLGGTFDGS